MNLSKIHSSESPEVHKNLFTYTTGNEVFCEDGNLDIAQSIDKTAELLIARNPEKYADFWESINKTDLLCRLMNVPDRKLRVEMLRYIYVAFRILDDVCDGDTPTKLSDSQRMKIVCDAANNDSSSYGLYNILLEKAFDIADQLDVRNQTTYFTNKIAGSLVFDIERILDENHIRSRGDIQQRSYDMDIDGTMFGSGLILWLNPEQSIQRLEWLWVASRKAYDIRDIFDDVSGSIYSMSLEDMEQFGITQQDLDKMKQIYLNPSLRKDTREYIPDGVAAWIESEIQQTYISIQQYKIGYSIYWILRDQQTIAASYPQSQLRRIWNNLLLRMVALKQWYENEIHQVISHPKYR